MVPLALASPRALANLYEDPEWSQKDLAGPTELLKTQVTKSKLGVLAPSQLQRYRQELAERAQLGYPACFTNLWALINEALLHDKVCGWEWPGQRGWEWAPAAGWGRPRAARSRGFRLRSPPSPQPHDHKLSDQREALSRGPNPLPIYCALNTKEKNLTTFEFGGEQPGSETSAARVGRGRGGGCYTRVFWDRPHAFQRLSSRHWDEGRSLSSQA